MDTVQKQIENSLRSEKPYFPPSEEIFKVQTDINIWPYNRYFRGSPSSDTPIVWEREAGFQEILPRIPVPSISSTQTEPNISTCFQLPCSTTLPCKSNPSNFQESRKSCIYISP